MDKDNKKKEPIKGKTKVKSIKEKKPKVDNKLKQENELLNDKVIRLSAEMQNMKRRFDEEMSRICKYDGEDFVKKLLPVVDNFERAIKLDDTNLNDELSKFLDGFKMIYTNLLSILNNYEVVEIEALKKEFDPNLMEAVLTAPEEGIEPNIVIEVLQKGYMYKDKVIRPVMVKVSE